MKKKIKSSSALVKFPLDFSVQQVSSVVCSLSQFCFLLVTVLELHHSASSSVAVGQEQWRGLKINSTFLNLVYDLLRNLEAAVNTDGYANSHLISQYNDWWICISFSLSLSKSGEKPVYNTVYNTVSYKCLLFFFQAV